jgi:succinoglycan biosynthesis protein ExoV
LIDPRWPVDVVLDHLLASERVICEAMHGAIIADALRIPWVAVQPIMAVNQPKWQDWADSLGIALRVATLAPSSWLEHVRRRFEGDRARLRWISYQGLKLHGRLNGFWIRDAAATLSGAARQEPQLSGDATIARVTERMIDKTRELRAGRHLVRAAA